MSKLYEGLYTEEERRTDFMEKAADLIEFKKQAGAKDIAKRVGEGALSTVYSPGAGAAHQIGKGVGAGALMGIGGSLRPGQDKRKKELLKEWGKSKEAGVLGMAAKGMGVGGAAGAVAGASSAKPGQSRLRRAAIGAGIGAAGGAAVGRSMGQAGAAAARSKEIAKQVRSAKGAARANRVATQGSRVEAAQAAADSAAQRPGVVGKIRDFGKGKLKVDPELMSPGAGLRGGTNLPGKATPYAKEGPAFAHKGQQAASVAGPAKPVQFYGIKNAPGIRPQVPDIQVKTAMLRRMMEKNAAPSTSALKYLAGGLGVGAAGGGALGYHKGKGRKPFAVVTELDSKGRPLYGGAVIDKKGRGGFNTKQLALSHEGRLISQYRPPGAGKEKRAQAFLPANPTYADSSVNAQSGDLSAMAKTAGMAGTAMRYIANNPYARNAAIWGGAGAAAGAAGSKPGNRLSGALKGGATGAIGGAVAGGVEKGLGRYKIAGDLSQLERMAEKKYPTENSKLPSLADEALLAVVEARKGLKDVKKLRTEIVSGKKPRSVKSPIPVPENIKVGADLLSKQVLPYIAGPALLLGAGNYLSSRPKKELGGKSRAEVDLLADVMANRASASDNDGLPTRVRHRMKEFQSGLATDFRKSPAAAGALGLTVGAGIGLQLAKVLGAR